MDRVSAFLEQQPKWAMALVATVVHGVLYLLPNHFQLASARPLPLTDLDRAIPFWPVTAWIYWSDYALVFVAFQLCRAPGATARFVYALSALVLIGTAAHWLWPTMYPRELYPLEPDATGLTVYLFERFRAADTPASCMPSLHVAASYLGAFAVHHVDRRRALGLLLWASAIFASTLTTKQHYVVDGLAGVALAAAVWRVAVRATAGTPDAETRSMRDHARALRLSLAALLAFGALNAFGGGYYGMSGAPGVPTEWLAGSPFSDFFIPSLILFAVVGGTFTVAAPAVLARMDQARTAATVAGLVVLGWLAVQVSIIGYVSWMQPATALAGVLVLVLAWRLRPSVSGEKGGPRLALNDRGGHP